MVDTLSILAVVAVLALVLFFATRSRKPELPSALEREQQAARREQLPAPERESEGERERADEAAKIAEAKVGKEPRDGAVAAEPVLEAPSAAADELPAPIGRPSDPAGPRTPREQAVAAMRQGLASTRGGFIARLARLFGGAKEIDKNLLEEIEEVLISADLGVRTTERILEELRGRMQRGELSDEQSVWTCLRAQAQAILDLEARPLALDSKPAVILVVGVNGVGKTTTIGKLASRYVAEGRKVLLAAGDTYRAAAVLQLEMWGKRVGCPVVRGKDNAEPGSVIFEAVKRAREEGFDLVIADTAGRLHTKSPLMEELKKVERTIAKANDGRGPDEVFLVLDSTTGQNAVQQMKLFRDALAITGVVLTKLDGTAKGGVVLGIVEQHGVPVRFIGLGERVEDLREFDAQAFVEALFAKPAEATLAA
jgi:fused signal recognition particle receptor